MNEPRIVASPGNPGRAQRVDSSDWWPVLGWIGVVFLVLGGLDFGLTWYPFDFGNREWEFASVTASFNGLVVPVLGIGLIMVASGLTGRRWWRYLAVLASVTFLLAVLVGVVLWATNIPLATRSVPLELATGLKKAMVKTAAQAVVYPALLVYLVRKGSKAPENS